MQFWLTSLSCVSVELFVFLKVCFKTTAMLVWVFVGTRCQVLS